MRPWIPSLLLLATLASSVVAQETQPASRPIVDHAKWDELLRKHVREERVDYLAIRAKHLPELNAYLQQLAAVRPEQLSPAEQLAYYINLYNATMVRVVAERLKEGYSVSENNFAVFDEPLIQLEEKAISLNDLEHKIIRPRFKDPRIHAALVCAARSCPPLLPRAYRAEDLDQVLEERMRKFVNDRSRNPIDVEKRELRLSAIFDWYADDFGGREKLAAYVDRYHEADLSGWTPTFVDYSWELNIATPVNGE